MSIDVDIHIFSSIHTVNRPVCLVDGHNGFIYLFLYFLMLRCLHQTNNIKVLKHNLSLSSQSEEHKFRFFVLQDLSE